ncbi:MAG: hypothetical protein FJW23_10215 [Acidimicrobiia bacterium]|nr:hypothetical protein [Acidimicrobiia bacterium]
MTEQSTVVAGAIVGALVGAGAAFLFLTSGGRAFRIEIEPAVDGMAREFERLRRTIGRMGDVADDVLRALEEFQTVRAEEAGQGGARH